MFWLILSVTLFFIFVSGIVIAKFALMKYPDNNYSMTIGFTIGGIFALSVVGIAMYFAETADGINGKIMAGAFVGIYVVINSIAVYCVKSRENDSTS